VVGTHDDDTSASAEEPAPSCAPKLALSLEEEQVLREMRAVRSEARAIKARILAATGAEHGALQGELEQARQRFRELRTALREANRIKLIRLGYDP